MGDSKSKSETNKKHQAAYGRGRKDADQAGTTENLAHDVVRGLGNALMPWIKESTETQSYEKGRADQISGDNPKPRRITGTGYSTSSGTGVSSSGVSAFFGLLLLIIIFVSMYQSNKEADKTRREREQVLASPDVHQAEEAFRHLDFQRADNRFRAAVARSSNKAIVTSDRDHLYQLVQVIAGPDNWSKSVNLAADKYFRVYASGPVKIESGGVTEEFYQSQPTPYKPTGDTIKFYSTSMQTARISVFITRYVDRELRREVIFRNPISKTFAEGDVLVQTAAPDKPVARVSRTLTEAAQQDDDSQVETLVANGADPNAPSTGLTPLMAAASRGNLGAVRALLAHGADVNMRDIQTGNSALWLAAVNGHSETVDVLLSAGADLNVKTKGDMTPLLAAAQEGHTSVVQLLLRNGADVDERNVMGATPLLLAAWNGQSATVRVLLEAGADRRAVDNDGFGVFRSRKPVIVDLDTQILLFTKPDGHPLKPQEASGSQRVVTNETGKP